MVFKFILGIDGWDIYHEISSRWMSLDFTDDKSTLVQVNAWCRQATGHYLNQCWPSSLPPLLDYRWHHHGHLDIMINKYEYRNCRAWLFDVIIKLSSEWRPNHGNVGFIIIQVSSVISFEHFIRKSMSILLATVLFVNKPISTIMMKTKNYHEYHFFKCFSPFSDFVAWLD